jgi:hypothetical protein
MIYFKPELDITAWELAAIVANIGSDGGHCFYYGSRSPRFGLLGDQSTIDSMAPGVRRHFTLEPPPDLPDWMKS